MTWCLFRDPWGLQIVGLSSCNSITLWCNLNGGARLTFNTVSSKIWADCRLIIMQFDYHATWTEQAGWNLRLSASQFQQTVGWLSRNPSYHADSMEVGWHIFNLEKRLKRDVFGESHVISAISGPKANTPSQSGSRTPPNWSSELIPTCFSPAAKRSYVATNTTARIQPLFVSH